MWLNGTPIVPATMYSVTVNSFLASGGDGFLELTNGAGKQDTGKTDLQAMVDYMAAFGAGRRPRSTPTTGRTASESPSRPLPRLATRRATTWPFNVSGWSMTNALDTKDTG